MTIFITLATGRVGQAVVRALLARNVSVRMGVRSVERARQQFPEAAVVRFDYTDPVTVAAAFHGVTALYLVAPHEGFDTALLLQAADAARQQGVRRVVLLSAQGVDQLGEHPARQFEQQIEQTWPEWTILRPNAYMQNYATLFAETIRQTGQLVEAAGDATTAFIDVRDLAAVAALALTEDGHQGQGYTLTGGKAYHRNEVAAAIGAATGQAVQYCALKDDAFEQHLIDRGLPAAAAAQLAALYPLLRSPLYNGVVTQTVERLLRRPPITFEQFALDYRDAWR